MPKMKTNKAAARRFKITATGKILRRQAGTRHLNEWMAPKVKRRLRGWSLLAGEMRLHVLANFPYRKYLR